MCGIAGVLAKVSPLASDLGITSMLKVQRHRGPDGMGVFAKPFVQVGMVRLAILDLAAKDLCPCTYTAPGKTEPTHALSYNGEIYNFVEIRERLEARGHIFHTSSDTEVLLHAYLEWGEDCLDHLNGMFAFVLADFEKDILFLARDIAGEKPLYFYEDSAQILVASEIKAILTQIPLPEVNITDEFRAFEYVTGNETLFKGIYALRPGHKLVFRGLRGNYKGKRSSEYWSLVDHLEDIDPSSALDRFDELLQDSIKIRLRSDVPLGLYLSGGLDSSLLAHFARPAIVFSTAFPDGPKYDESGYAKIMADAIHAEQVFVRPTKEEFDSWLDTIIYHLDMPVGSFSAFPLYALAKVASKRVKVVLSGEGADELFSGYTRYLLPTHDLEIYQVPELSNYQALLDYYYGKPLDKFARLLNRGTVEDEVVKTVIAKYFTQFEDIRHAMGYTEFKLMLVTLLHMEDRASAAFGIENRSPFLDKRIIAFAFSISPELKIQNSTTKWLVRELAKRYLPEKIWSRRDKAGLIAPINRWMNFHGKRGEFDRGSYNKLCMERWIKVFFEERWFERLSNP